MRASESEQGWLSDCEAATVDVDALPESLSASTHSSWEEHRNAFSNIAIIMPTIAKK